MANTYQNFSIPIIQSDPTGFEALQNSAVVE